MPPDSARGFLEPGRDTEHQPCVVDRSDDGREIAVSYFKSQLLKEPSVHMSKQEHGERRWLLKECWGTDTTGAFFILVSATSSQGQEFNLQPCEPNCTRRCMGFITALKANCIYTHIGTGRYQSFEPFQSRKTTTGFSPSTSTTSTTQL